MREGVTVSAGKEDCSGTDGKSGAWSEAMRIYPKGKSARTAVFGAITMATLITGVCLWVNWGYIELWLVFERVGWNAQGYAEYRHRQTGIVFVRIPAGSMLIGSAVEEWERVVRQYVEGFEVSRAQAEEWVGGERPEHAVTLGAFLIGKYEVTRAEWWRVMETGSAESGGEDLPVEQVSWDECEEFCRKSGLRLPTEAQWEVACRAGQEATFWGSKSLERECWYEGNSAGRAHAVGSKEPNGCGLYDMSGNVSEWCYDIYDHAFNSKAEAREPEPVCTTGSDFRVVRGGNWGAFARNCRCEYRDSLAPSGRNAGIGFRPAFYPLP